METADRGGPQVPPARPAPLPFWLRMGALGLLVAFLFTTSYFSLRTPASEGREDVARLQLESTLLARQVFLARTLKIGSVRAPTVENSKNEQKVLSDLRRLAGALATPQAIRDLALMQYTLGDPAWKTTLARLRSAPGRTQPLEMERELAMWRDILEGHPARAVVPEYRARIEAMRLGWFEHLALIALYRHAGMADAAERETSAANRTTLLVSGLTMLAVAAALAGLCIAAWAVYLLARRFGEERAGVPPVAGSAGATAALRPLPRAQADGLYFVFLAYLLSFAFLRLVMSWVLPHFWPDAVHRLSQSQQLLLSMALNVLSIVPPWALFRRLSARTGLRAADIGLRSRQPAVDIAVGVMGYMAALPLLVVTSLISEWLFRGFHSPSHPVLAEFTALRGVLPTLLMFAQVAVLPPLIEETMFRGVLFRSLSRRAGTFGALLLASGIFAILHPQLPLGFLAIFTLGVVFNVQYLLRGSLLPNMVTHALNNGMILFLMLLLTRG